MEEIRRFNADVSLKEAVKEYFDAFIAKECVRMAYDRKDVSHIADAKELIEGAFNLLEETYGLKEKPPVLVNEAK